MHLSQDILILSMFRDKEVLDLMRQLEVGSIVTDFFVDAEEMSRVIKRFMEISNFSWDFHNIMSCYNVYSRAFFDKKLSENLQISDREFNNALLNIHRREIKGELDHDEQLVKNTLEKSELEANAKNEDWNLIRMKHGFRSVIKKALNFPHKLHYNTMYVHNFNLNKGITDSKINESDYKCDFYDLAEITLRDKTILKNDVDSILNYGELDNRRFKIKRVEQLFLNLSDYYSI